MESSDDADEGHSTDPVYRHLCVEDRAGVLIVRFISLNQDLKNGDSIFEIDSLCNQPIAMILALQRSGFLAMAPPNRSKGGTHGRVRSLPQVPRLASCAQKVADWGLERSLLSDSSGVWDDEVETQPGRANFMGQITRLGSPKPLKASCRGRLREPDHGMPLRRASTVYCGPPGGRVSLGTDRE
jgi:hypothetical protein